MSTLSRMLNTAREVLGTHDARRLAPNPHQPPVFVRTNYLLAEIDDAIASAGAIASRIRVARLGNDVADAARLTADLARLTRQLAQLSVWTNEQFQKEMPHGD